MRPRAILSYVMVLILVLTSQAIGFARGASAATDQMVLCTGSGTQIIFVDAEGQPTAAPHMCPDCMVHADLGAIPQISELAGRLVIADLPRLRASLRVAVGKRYTPQTRAPPHLA